MKAVADPSVAHRAPLRLRGAELRFGTRTFVMGILNVTPDSFSGDGLLADERQRLGSSFVAEAVDRAGRMVAEGADIVDVGGESTRPGHEPVTADEEAARVVAVVGALRAALPDVPISIDTTKDAVAEAALDAGADIVNDVAAVSSDGALARVAAARRVPYVITHDRPLPGEDDIVGHVLADLSAVVDRAVSAGCERGSLIVDPGIGFGKDAAQNLALLGGLARLTELGLPVLLGASRKSTIGRVLDLPPDQRLEGTLATTALAIAAGVDIVRVHDVEANVRAARMADAVVRGWTGDARR
jgi:dihydropteroate synthase